MSKSDRLFEIIQILRAATKPVRADDLAQTLEVSSRTIYRDITTLQARNTPIEGEAGIGYIMRNGYDLPPLNFNEDEIEALRVGLLMLSRTGDSKLQSAATSIRNKIDALQDHANWLQVASWGAPLDDPELGCVSKALLRRATREERKLKITYRNRQDCETIRVIRPIALLYHLECVILVGWCELRGGLRHFRTDRIYECEKLEDSFVGDSSTLRTLWLDQNSLDLADQTFAPTA